MSKPRQGYTIATTEEETARSQAIAELASQYESTTQDKILEFLCKFGETALRHNCTKKDATSKLLTALATVVGGNKKDKIERELLVGKPTLIEGTTQLINGVEFVKVRQSAVRFDTESERDAESGSWQTATSYTRKVPEGNCDKQFFTTGTPLREAVKAVRDLSPSKFLTIPDEVIEVEEGEETDEEEEKGSNQEGGEEGLANSRGARGARRASRSSQPVQKKSRCERQRREIAGMEEKITNLSAKNTDLGNQVRALQEILNRQPQQKTRRVGWADKTRGDGDNRNQDMSKLRSRIAGLEAAVTKAHSERVQRPPVVVREKEDKGMGPAPCRFWPLGSCSRGNSCRFKHGDSVNTPRENQWGQKPDVWRGPTKTQELQQKPGSGENGLTEQHLREVEKRTTARTDMERKRQTQRAAEGEEEKAETTRGRNPRHGKATTER